MTAEEYTKAKERLKELEEEIALVKKNGEERWRLEYEIREEEKKRRKEKYFNEDMEIIKKYLHEHTEQSELYCIKFEGKLWKSEHGKYAWNSIGRAKGALKNSLISFGSACKVHTNSVNEHIEELIKNGNIEICKF